jgi:ATP-dependent DNA helicase DinG
LSEKPSFCLSESSKQLVAVGVQQARGQSVAFLAGLDSADNLIGPKVVARSNYEAMVQVARDTTEPGVLLISHQSEDFLPSEAEILLGKRIEKHGLGFGIISSDGQRINILNSPAKAGEAKLLQINRIEELISPSGKMNKLHNNYEDRRGQREMLRLVARTYNRGGLALVEAGTGTGKSLAYLIPSVLWAQQNREVSVISTSTINLQQQLVTKDIPLVEKLLGKKIRWALVKGRNNYISIRRLYLAMSNDLLLFGTEHSEELREIASWSEETLDGSLSDMAFVPSQKVWDEVKSDSGVCLGRACPSYQECHYQNARKRVSSAHLLVVNHHILLSDASVKDGNADNTEISVLPDYKRLVIDEAHNIEDVATTHFGVRVTTDGILRVLQRFSYKGLGLVPSIKNSIADSVISQELVQVKKGLENELSSSLRFAKENLELFLDSVESEIHVFSPGSFYCVPFITTEVPANSIISKASEQLVSSLEILRNQTIGVRQKLESGTLGIDGMNGRILDLMNLETRLKEITNCLRKIFSGDHQDESHVRWIQWSRRTDRNLRMYSVPVESGEILRDALFLKMTTLVLTSATLTTQGSFEFIRGKIGLGAKELKLLPEKLTPTEMTLTSEFDFNNQAILAIPTDFPDVRTSGDLYHEKTAEAIQEVVSLAKGGVLVLFTSWESLKKVSNLLRESSISGVSLLIQGEDTRSRLLSKLTLTQQGVLLGVGSFWEGIDVPGSALQTVIIPRLPFSVPTTPVNAARIEQILLNGGNFFKDLLLPTATLKLKQGFGRLIRSSTDRGVVVILDKRMAIQSYGRHMMDSLPPAEVISGPWESIKKSLQKFYELDE